MYLEQYALTLLASVSGVDLNTATPTALYTVPTGFYCVIDHMRVRAASTSLTTASASSGFNSAAYNDVIADGAMTELTASDLHKKRDAKAGAKIGAAGNVLYWQNNTLQGAAATATVDVFGYLF